MWNVILPSGYMEVWDWEDHGLRSAAANSLWDPISKIARVKWTGGVVRVAVHMLCEYETLTANPSPAPHPPKKKLVKFCNSGGSNYCMC
jgi:hypothetical protein